MVQQDQSADAIQSSQMIAWLEEQRKLDRDQLLRVQRDVERLSLRINELTAHLQQIGEEGKLDRSRLAINRYAEEGIRQLREQMSVLQERSDARDQVHERETMLRQSEMEREKKIVTELAQQLSYLSSQTDNYQSKLQPLAEEIKRERAELQGIVGRIEMTEKANSALVGHIQLLEEYAKRFDVRAAAFEHTQETLRSDQARLQQWQQAAELRWTRQVTQWQEQMDEWKRESGGQVNSVQLLMKQLIQIKEEINDLRDGAAENHKLIENNAAGLAHLENLRSHDREDFSRLEQSIELQRRRMDEQASAAKALQEQLTQNGQALADVQGRLDGERKRMDELWVSFKQFDSKQAQAFEEMLQLQKVLREQGHDLTRQAQSWQQLFEQLQQGWDQQILSIHRLAEQQKLRDIAELERQLMEIRDRLGQNKGWGTG